MNNPNMQTEHHRFIVNCQLSVELPAQLLASMVDAVLKTTNEKTEQHAPIPASVRNNSIELPDVLSAAHIAKYLGIARNTVYDLFNINPDYGGIPNFDVGQSQKASKRVIRKDFFDWIAKQKHAKNARFLKN